MAVVINRVGMCLSLRPPRRRERDGHTLSRRRHPGPHQAPPNVANPAPADHAAHNVALARGALTGSEGRSTAPDGLSIARRLHSPAMRQRIDDLHAPAPGCIGGSRDDSRALGRLISDADPCGSVGVRLHADGDLSPPCSTALAASSDASDTAVALCGAMPIASPTKARTWRTEEISGAKDREAVIKPAGDAQSIKEMAMTRCIDVGIVRLGGSVPLKCVRQAHGDEAGGP